MKDGLKEITKDYEGKIWKGFVGNTLYVDPDDHKDRFFDGMKGTKLKIAGNHSFDFKENAKTHKYSDYHGCYFSLKKK